MKVIRIHRFGDPEVLELDEVPVPRPGENELLVRIHAASMNPIDHKIRRSAVPAITPDMPPITLGRDGSGTVEAIGPGMNAFRQGGFVYALLGGPNRRSYVEYVVLKPSEAAPKRMHVSDVEGAAFRSRRSRRGRGCPITESSRPARQSRSMAGRVGWGARRRACGERRRGRGTDTLSAGDDDGGRVHHRCTAAGVRYGCRSGSVAPNRHHRVWRGAAAKLLRILSVPTLLRPLPRGLTAAPAARPDRDP
jgi:hypothetical protein